MLKSSGPKKTLSLVDPKKRSLRSNTVIEVNKETALPNEGTATKKRERKAVEKASEAKENGDESAPTKGKDFTFLMKNKYKKNKDKKKRKRGRPSKAEKEAEA